MHRTSAAISVVNPGLQTLICHTVFCAPWPNRRTMAEVCRHYAKHNSCRHGDRCRYVHVPGDFGEPGPNLRQRTCRDYLRTGSCWRGERCKYAHSDIPENTNSLNICREHLRNGICRWGDSCKYADSHNMFQPEPPSQPSREPYTAMREPITATREPDETPQTHNKCIICADAEVNVAYAACGHLCFCHECSESGSSSLASCPMCRRPSARVRLQPAGF